jgi:hypothetical protein
MGVRIPSRVCSEKYMFLRFMENSELVGSQPFGVVHRRTQLASHMIVSPNGN